MSRSVLAVAAHPDDEVLGAGATLAKHADAGHEVTVLIVTEGTTAQYDDDSLIDQKREEARACAETLGVDAVRFGDLPDMRLDTVPHVEVNAVVEDAVEDLDPDVVYTHSPHDVNEDHAAVAASTRVATRPGSGVEEVLAYEVPSSTGWAGGDRERFQPTTYVDVTDHVDRKVEAFEAYETERREYPHPRSPRAIRALGETRGTDAGFPVAEAFQLVAAYRSEL